MAAIVAFLTVLICLLLADGAALVTKRTDDKSEIWGYVSVRPRAHIFWWHYTSPHRVSSPTRPWPTILLLQGSQLGGSSVGNGNFAEIGPLDEELKPRNSTWLHKADLLFVDHPVGVGYSYADDRSGLATTDVQAAADATELDKALATRILPDLKSSPLFIVGQAYGGKLAAMIGASLAKAIRAGDINLTLGGVVIGNGWISLADFSTFTGRDTAISYFKFSLVIRVPIRLTYARMLSDVSWLDGNAVDEVNKMAGKVKEQTAAGQFATSLQTFTDLLYLIDSKSDSVNMFNYMTGTGMGMMLITGDNTPKARSSPLTMYLGRDISTIMNGVIKRKLKIIPKDLVWQQWSLDVYEAMKNDFMRPAINVVDELLSLGVNVTLYNGQLDVLCSSTGTQEWLKKLKKPLHFCLPYYIPNGFVKAHKNLQHYSILQAGQAVPVDQPCTALHMIGAIMQSPDV
uniref:Carboxypeptidase n=1 Tax=Oryza glumipatula TaxID=40148 RepID=A0A0D9Z8F2_9ORYZ